MCEGAPSRSYSVPALANWVASQQYCYIMGSGEGGAVSGEGGGGGGGGGGARDWS